MLAGARAYLGGNGKAKDVAISKALSEPALHAPVTPKTPRGKIRTSSRSKSRTSSEKSLIEEDSPKEGEQLARRKKSDPSLDPQTPRAKQKIRRASIGLMNSPNDLLVRDSGSVSDSVFAVSPSTKKSKRRATSVGPLEDVKRRTSSSGERDRKSRSESKEKEKEKKKTRHHSNGPLERRSKRSSRTPTTTRHPSLSSLKSELSDLPLPIEEKLREPSDNSSLSKSRMTVDGEGRIRRVKKSSASGSDEEDGKSKYSSSSKRSKLSSKSKKTSTKTKDRGPAKESLRATRMGSSDSDMGRSSEGSERGSRSSRRTDAPEVSERRAGKRSIVVDEAPDSILHIPSGDSDYNDGQQAELEESSRGRSNRISTSDEVTFETHDAFMNFAEATSRVNTDEDVAQLNKKVMELNEEILKIQFAAQSEAAKMRKELREEKLELQRSQTERRELRAQLRERDQMIDESFRRIQALEKAVESQLDKVDDLEEELRRANEEIFDLEGKLGDMEQVLAESSAIETTALQKEKDFGEKREERMERRLEEREKDLEERERKLREERNSMVKNGQSQRNMEQLEQDNRMLLKTLNRERAEAADKLKEKEEESNRLEKELKVAKMRSYSHISHGSTDGTITSLLEKNADLQRRFDEKTDQLSEALKKKDDRISSLEEKLKNVIGPSDMNGSSGDNVLMTEIESLKVDLLVARNNLEGAQRRNQLLEDDIDHWKSVNCKLEDELAEWKTQVANWRSKYEDAIDLEGEEDTATHVSAPNILPFMLKRDQSVANVALGRQEDDDDAKTTVSEPATSIANLWSKLTTPTAKRKTVANINAETVQEVLARTTFH